MAVNFHICTVKTFLKALNVLFTVDRILTETTMRPVKVAGIKSKHLERFNKKKPYFISWVCCCRFVF